MGVVALLDANVLVNAPVRDTLLRAAERDLYRLALTERILAEAQYALEANLGRTSEQTGYLMGEIRRSFPESFIVDYESLEPNMQNQKGDRHVLAAAVHAHADVIVTLNVRDFPSAACAPYAVSARHPEIFLLDLWHEDPVAMADVLVEQAQDLQDWTLERLINRLARDLPAFAEAVLPILRQKPGTGPPADFRTG